MQKEFGPVNFEIDDYIKNIQDKYMKKIVDKIKRELHNKISQLMS